MGARKEKFFPQAEKSTTQGAMPSKNLERLLDAARSFVPDVFAGAKFSKYVVRQVISERDDAWLVKAEDPVLNRTVILKIDAQDSAQDTLQQAETEGRAIAAVNHPNIVKVWGVEHFQGRPFLVLEYIDGMTLEDFCDNRPICEATALDIATQIAEGLAAIHRRGLLHLDLKPSNVVITREGVAKIIDFGLSKRIDEVSFGEIAGTPGYLAPERSGDTPHEIGVATDVFGLGAILFNLLTQASPHEGDTTSEKVLNSLRGKVSDPQWGNWRVSKRTQNLVNACLNRSPQERPQTVDLVIDRISYIQKYLKLRKGLTVGILAVCSLLVLALIFPDQVVSIQNSYASDTGPRVVETTPLPIGLLDRQNANFTQNVSASEALQLSSTESVNGSESQVFERLHDETFRTALWRMRRGDFAEAENVLRDTCEAVEDFFPAAEAFCQCCEADAELNRSLADLDLYDRTKIAETVKFILKAKEEKTFAEFPGNEKMTDWLTRAYENSKSTLGAKHGWTIRCQGELMLAKLLDRGQPIPSMTDFDSLSSEIHTLYRNASYLETELHYRLTLRLISQCKQKGWEHTTVAELSDKDKTQHSDIQLIIRHSRRSVLLAKEYYRGRHRRQTGIMSSMANLEFFWLKNEQRGVEYCREIIRICENERNTKSNVMVQALLILAEHHVRASQYDVAINHLRRAKEIAEGLVFSSAKSDSIVKGHQAEASRMYLEKCQSKIKDVSPRIVLSAEPGVPQ
ncbi:serine/threonine protein kinase [bacterium]|nr:serine/threonine protein kinase [bacterium]